MRSGQASVIVQAHNGSDDPRVGGSHSSLIVGLYKNRAAFAGLHQDVYEVLSVVVGACVVIRYAGGDLRRLVGVRDALDHRGFACREGRCGQAEAHELQEVTTPRVGRLQLFIGQKLIYRLRLRELLCLNRFECFCFVKLVQSGPITLSVCHVAVAIRGSRLLTY